jgi:hypothetical protein
LQGADHLSQAASLRIPLYPGLSRLALVKSADAIRGQVQSLAQF